MDAIRDMPVAVIIAYVLMMCAIGLMLFIMHVINNSKKNKKMLNIVTSAIGTCSIIILIVIFSEYVMNYHY